ncbi:Protein kinase-like domain [Pseudocohnilembus persalinus]|uniref:Protein kinase-like domain n=1 Tax=Pseudocohnilembus persalinus TaxID=266149 RepID=A0A0V0QGJ2_PSEPJ|nr:Protein kinase-like domain [Pseudocohnilembus persalinus]|eukprot:KRX01276.1 Protein kinase-like domain [Pseudocohnilembus persalinus]
MQQQENNPNQVIASFHIPQRYEKKKLIGSGAYGQVILAQDTLKQKKVAIKKLHKIEDIIDAKRVLREIRILRYLNHENIIYLSNLHYDDSEEGQDFGNIYIITEFIDIDLYKVIKSGQNLTDEHIQFIIYQILKAVKYLHSANIVHRDLKPSNLLATERCEIRVCDFGLSRQINNLPQSQGDQNMTEYVVTRYYRAPEIMLSSHEYSKAVDIWSVGCTLAELLTKKILFKANNYIDQIKLIMKTLGKPGPSDLGFITNSNARKFVDQLPDKEKVSVKTFIKYENEKALDLLDKMLTINPATRYSADQCLKHPYLSSLHDESDEPVFEGNIDFSFEDDTSLSLDQLRTMILQEVNYYKQKNNEERLDINQCMQSVKQKRKVLEEEAKKLQQIERQQQQQQQSQQQQAEK